MNSFSMVNASYAFNLIDVHDLCRICGNMNNTFTSIYEDDGNLLDISSKINEYLPITVSAIDLFLYSGKIQYQHPLQFSDSKD